MAGLSIDFNYEEGEAGKFTPVVRDVQLNLLNTRKAQYALFLRGFANAPIQDVPLSDCDFQGVQKRNVLENVRTNGVVVPRIPKRFLRGSLRRLLFPGLLLSCLSYAREATKTITVATDGTGNFRSVQEAGTLFPTGGDNSDQAWRIPGTSSYFRSPCQPHRPLNIQPA